ncbi:hypothetical protein FAP48_13600 [Morganella morganii]|nr:hypothetical protein [Morganella morganii]EGT3635300.1 hypothetical protein [Morganella morganii]
MFNLTISISIKCITMTKSYCQPSGDRDGSINKGIGFKEVMKNLENKMAPYLFIINLLQAVGYVCALIL